jgi:hypothetical protein
MINRWMGDVALLIQAKIGVTSALIVWAAVVVIASLTAFVFLCVTGYDWLSRQLGAAFAGLSMASAFLVIALIGATFCAASGRRAKQRAMLARAARAQGLAPRLLDPKILGVAMHAGRTFGWRRVVTLVLVAFLGVQLVRATEPQRASDQ